MKAIETVHSGYRFRSRLEARWAVFFETLGIPYEYEKEGFDLDGVWYLPDFWLPEQQRWVEVKGQSPTSEEFAKAALLHKHSGKACYIFAGEIGIPQEGQRPIAGWGPGEETFKQDFFWCQCPICKRVDICPMGFCFILPCKCTWEVASKLHELPKDQLARQWAYLVFQQFVTSDLPALNDAYIAARQARFEHGENTR